MAKTAKPKTKTAPKSQAAPRLGLRRRVTRLLFRCVALVVLIAAFLTLVFKIFNPPTTPYMFSESRRLGGVTQEWASLDEIAPVMARSAVAAEDANFCLHWGLDVKAIEAALDAGGTRGASTISQQVVKNVFLMQDRSWIRKAIEALWTPMTEVIWSKRRILELYLNVAEFGEGVFGVQAGAQYYFGVDAADLSALQAARLAAVLPNPKERNAANPTSYLRKRTKSIMDGAATIAVDGRAGCFTD